MSDLGDFAPSGPEAEVWRQDAGMLARERLEDLSPAQVSAMQGTLQRTLKELEAAERHNRILARATRRALRHVDGRDNLTHRGILSLRQRLRSALIHAGYDPDRDPLEET